MSGPAEYRERLLPSWWVWLAALGFVGMLAVAYGAALGTRSGLAVAIAGTALVFWLLWITAPVTLVTPEKLVVAGASLPRSAIASAECVDRAAIVVLRGPGGDARLFVELRPWSASGGLMVRIDDPDDPHPAWLFSSRHPARVQQALTGTMGAAQQ